MVRIHQGALPKAKRCQGFRPVTAGAFRRGADPTGSAQNHLKPSRSDYFLPSFYPRPVASPPWLKDLSRSFKRSRGGRGGWFLQLHHDRLRVLSAELPLRPDEPAAAAPKLRAVTLQTSAAPDKTSEALTEAMAIHEAVMAGTWRWPDPEDCLPAGNERRLRPEELNKVILRLEKGLLGETVALLPRQRPTHRGTGGAAAGAAGPGAGDAGVGSATPRQLRECLPHSSSVLPRGTSLIRSRSLAWPRSPLAAEPNKINRLGAASAIRRWTTWASLSSVTAQSLAGGETACTMAPC